ncbi:MAG: GNAT family N-acetyltransferase [Thalassotalea sp.]|nr:GNAT family N-acetyltransferase [Thalassotalea sp.]
MKELTFETERLTVRPMRDEDRDFFVSLHTDEKIMKLTGGKLSEEVAHKKFRNAIDLNSTQSFTFKTWTVFDKKKNVPVGIQVLFRPSTPSSASSLEIGIILSRLFQGKGLPEEAMGGLMEFAFKTLGTKKIVATFSHNNLATKRFVRKLGFQFLPRTSDDNSFHIYFNADDWTKKLLIS